MAELAFEQQVILTLLDKGLFAAIGIALTVWGLRLVEGYKAKEATRLEATKAGETLRVEVTKEKVKKIEAIWSEFSDLETELTRIAWDTSQVRGEAGRQLVESGQLKLGPKGFPADEPAIEEIAIPQLKLEILPRILQLEARRQQIRHKIDVVDRFWLGASIAADLLARTNIYGNILDRLKTFEPSPFQGVPKLSERDDVDKFVDALLKKG